MLMESPLVIALIDLSVIGFIVAAIAMLFRQRKAFGTAISPLGLICAGAGIAIFGLHYLTDFVVIISRPSGQGVGSIHTLIRSDISWLTGSYGLILLFASLLLGSRHISSKSKKTKKS